MEMLRERIKGLEMKIVEMIRHSQENVAIADRLHRWTRALMLTPDAAQLPEVLLRELQQQFLVPRAGLRVWGVDAAHADLPQAATEVVIATAQHLRLTDVPAAFGGKLVDRKDPDYDGTDIGFVEAPLNEEQIRTYIGHALACAAALAVQRVIQRDDLLPRVQRLGAGLHERLQAAFAQHPPPTRA